jgi:probable phosphoglycerate mutase
MAPAAPPATTLLLRHGQTEHSVDRRFSGSSNPELTEVGRDQAAAAAARLVEIARHTPITAVYASPLRRAQATAGLAADALGLTVTTLEDVRETDFGEWEGFTFGEVQRRWPEDLARWLADAAVPPPGGESFAATAARVLPARDSLRESHSGETVLVVSHVTPIKVLLRDALEAPPSALYRIHLDLASLSWVDWHADGGAVVRSMNVTPY